MMGGSTTEQVSASKTLGVIFNDMLTWDDHLDEVCSKVSRRLYFLRIEYACELLHPGITVANSHSLEHIQERALAISYPDLEYQEALKTTGLENLARKQQHNDNRHQHKNNTTTTTQEEQQQQ